MASYKLTTLETTTVDDENQLLLIDDWTLAFHLGFSGKALWFATRHRDQLYRTFTKPKASGGVRTIHNPSPLIRVITKQIRRKMLLPQCEKLGDHVTAYRKGRGITAAAQRHLAPCETCATRDAEHTCTFAADENGHVRKVYPNDCVACRPVPDHKCPRRGVKVHMDLSDFFGSTRRAWIRKYFHETLGYNHFVSGMLAQLLTVTLKDASGREYAGVPQGGKASGDITNLVADQRLDQPMLKALPEGWTYSRYADDLYFSHPEDLSREEVNRMMNKARAVIRKSGYRVNEKKSHVQRAHRQQKLLGAVLNQKISIPKDVYRRMRALLRTCWRDGFEPVAIKMGKSGGPELQGWIEGKLAYFSSISPNRMRDLKARYELAKAKHPEGSEMSFTFESSPEQRFEAAMKKASGT